MYPKPSGPQSDRLLEMLTSLDSDATHFDVLSDDTPCAVQFRHGAAAAGSALLDRGEALAYGKRCGEKSSDG